MCWSKNVSRLGLILGLGMRLGRRWMGAKAEAGVEARAGLQQD